MALVDYGDKILGEIIEQAEWTHSRVATVEIPRIILYSGAVAHFSNHFYVVGYPFLQPCRLKQSPFIAKLLDACAQVEFYLRNRGGCALFGGYKYVCREYLECFKSFFGESGVGVYGLNRLYLVSPEYHSQLYFFVCKFYIHSVSLHSECASSQFMFGPRVKRIYKCAQKCIALQRLPHGYCDNVLVEIIGIPDSIQARHRRHHNDVSATRQQSRGGGKAKPVYLLVYHQVFLDIFVSRWYISLGLVIIVVGNEIMNRIIWEKTLEFRVQLCCKSLIVR